VPFGRYTLLAPLAMGGMGEIFLARLEGHHGFEKLCVIKKILPGFADEPDFVARFVNEAKILVKLSHGSIAQVLEMNLQDGAPYIALEFVDGKDLRKVAQRLKDKGQPFPIPLALYVMTRVLDALGYAHRKKDDRDQELRLVHRDVSPQNVLLSYEGEVKVIDFGLAKSSLSSAKTHPAMVLGKFLYMSPEQARHQRVDRRSDLYSAGLCLYELIAGKNPLEDVQGGDLLDRVIHPDFQRLSEVVPRCPRGVSDAVMKALAVDPMQRFQTAEEMRARLLGALLELDPSAGAESAADLMREHFAPEYQQERKLVAAARDPSQSSASERIAAGKRSTMTALPALQPDGSLAAAAPSQGRPAPAIAAPGGPPPLPSAPRASPPPPPLPSLSREVEPTQPGARASEIEETHRRVEAAARAAARAQPPPPPPEARLGAHDETRPGVPSPLLDLEDETASGMRSPFNEPTVPGIYSPLLAQPASAHQALTREIPVQDATANASGPATRELRIQIPDGARPTPSDRPAASAAVLSDLLAAGSSEPSSAPPQVVPPRPLPGFPPPHLGAAAPTLPAMPIAPAATPEDPPVVLGVLLDEPAAPPPPVRPQRRESAEASRPPPALTPVSLAASSPPVARTQTEPSLRRAALAPGSALERHAAKPRRMGWVTGVVGALVIGVVAFFAHDFYAAGLFDGALVHLPTGLRAGLHLHAMGAEETPAVPEAVPLDTQVLGPRGPPALRIPPPPKPAPVAASPAQAPSAARPAAQPEETAPDEDSDLALLQALPAAARGPARHPKAPHRGSALQKEWARARSEFRKLEEDSPCEADGMGMLCTRYRALEASVGSAEDPNDPRLLERVKEIRRLIAKKASP